MRKISYEAALAFCHNAHYKNDNTEVVVSERDCMTVMRLHGHIIATRVGVRVRVTLAGYGTPTTSRYYLPDLNMSIIGRRGTLYLTT